MKRNEKQKETSWVILQLCGMNINRILVFQFLRFFFFQKDVWIIATSNERAR